MPSAAPNLHRLTHPQRRVWYEQGRHPTSAAHAVGGCQRFRGELDAEALVDAVREVIETNDALRLRLVEEGGEIWQHLPTAARDGVPFLDFSEAPCPEDALQAWLRDDARTPVASTGALARFAVFRVSSRDHGVAARLHHLVADGWSARLVVSRICDAYLRAKGSTSERESPFSYLSFLAAESAYLRSEAAERARAFWRARYATLPAHFLYGSSTLLDARRRTYRIAGEQARRLKAVARTLRCSLAPLFVSLMALYLKRFHGIDDAIIGVPAANRRNPAARRTVGMYANPLPVRVPAGGAASMRDLVRRTRAEIEACLVHQEYPYDLVLRDLEVARRGYEHLFQVAVNCQAVRPPGTVLGAAIETVELHPESQLQSLQLGIREWAGTGEIDLDVDHKLADYTERDVDELYAYLWTLVERAGAAPDEPLARATRAGAPAQARPDASHAAVPARETVHVSIAALARRAPLDFCIDSDGLRVTRGELAAASHGVAQLLRERGVGPRARVGLCAERSFTWAAGALGILEAGATAVPLDPLAADPATRALAEARPKLVLAERSAAAALGPDRPSIAWVDEERLAARGGPRSPLVTVSDLDAAWVAFSGWSRGSPRGAAISHLAVLHRLRGAAQAGLLVPGDVLLGLAPPGSWVAIFELCWALASGACIVLRRGIERWSGERVARAMDEAGATALHATPGAWRALLASGWRAGAGTKLLASGEPLARGLALELSAGGAEVWNVYARAAAGGFVAAHRFDPLSSDAPEERAEPIGQPLPGTKLHVLDELLEPVPVGFPGELFIGGDALGSSLIGDAGGTASEFVPDPAGGCPGARLLRTGDLAHQVASGGFELLGRTDRRVHARGLRIDLDRVEAALLCHSSVAGAAVACEAAGAGRLAAYVQAHPRAPVTELALLRFLRERLPAAMVPAGIAFVTALPRTPDGKVDRARLRVDADAAVRARGEAAATDEPRTQAEEVLAAIWAKALGRDRVGVRDDLFALGGDSLVATHVVARVRQVFSVELSIQALFEAPTVEEMARRLERRGSERTTRQSIPRAAPADRQSPSYAQERMWFLEQRYGAGGGLNQAAAFHLDGPLDVAALERSLDVLVRRHEMLRTGFRFAGGRVVHVLRNAVSMPLTLADLEAVAPAARTGEVERAIRDVARRRFDLTTPPLVRSALLRLAPRSHVLAIVAHHIVADARSADVIARELSSHYAAFRAGRLSPLPELPVQFADYAAWERARLTGSVLDAHLAFWRRQLDGAALDLSLPPAAAAADARPSAGTVPMELDDALWARVRELGRARACTPFMMLLAAFAAALHRETARPDVVVGTLVANRPHEDLSDLVGFFVNTVPLRCNVGGDPTFGELLERVRAACLGAFDHQELPLGHVLDAVGAGRAPLPILFLLETAPMVCPALDGLAVRPFERHGAAALAGHELVVTFRGSADRIAGTLAYRTDRFRAAQVKQLARTMEAVLNECTTRPDARLGRLGSPGFGGRNASQADAKGAFRET